MSFRGLGEEPRDVCATNLIFKGSTDAQGAGYPKLAKPCWQVHAAIIEIVQPEAIITFGVQAFEFVAQQRGGQSVQFSYSRPGYWSWQHSILADGKKLIGTRHPSRYALRNNLGVVNEIKKLLGLV
jgi:uracil-DNA glycosylase